MSTVRQATREDFAAFGVESSEGDTTTGLTTPSLHQKLDIPSPGFIIALYNKAFREGAETLYEWQKEQLAEIGDSLSATVHNPYKLCLCAANGSGKDYVIVAPTAVWMALVSIRALIIITSSSGAQLTAQTENYIRALCATVNEYHGQEIFRIRQRHIVCNLSGSEIRLFATDEAGKAEGYHPLEPGAKMVIIVNEAKSVAEEIFGALRRCTGYTHWLNVSTPGAPSGSFHRACTNLDLGFRFRRVNYKDCRAASGVTHVSEKERLTDLAELGATSALYRSKWLALFTTVDANTVLNLDHVNVCKNIAPSHQTWPLRVGIDIAAGGDETVIVALKGNQMFAEVAWREKDTVIAANRIHEELRKLDIKYDHQFIYADDGGIGRSVIDMLRDKGWSINRILNQSRALRPQQYGNRGAELWFNVKRLVEERVVNLTGWSETLIEQLTDRRYKASAAGGRVFLESKADAKAEGRKSPDRADAYVLAHTGLTVTDFLSEELAKQSKPRQVLRTPEDLQQYMDDLNYGEPELVGPGDRSYNNLSSIL